MAFKNNFFTFDDFVAILGEIRHKIAYYRSEKHTLALQDVQGIRDDMSVLCAQLSDIGADLYSDEVDTARNYRYELLKRTQERELEYREGKDEQGKRWTDIANRARYQAEIDCIELRAAMDSASATHRLASNLYRVTIPKVLDSLSSRIAILIRQMDGKSDFKEISRDEPNNPWAEMDTLNFHPGFDSQMEDLDKEIKEVTED